MRHQHGPFDDCKGPLRHAWFLADVARKTEFGTPTSFMCERCTTVRIDIFDIHGELMGRRYIYPEGYKDAQEQRLTMPQMRLRMLSKHRSTKIKQRKEVTKHD